MLRSQLHLATLALACVSLFLAGPSAAAAQEPSIGDYYEDSVDIGFRLRMPKDWVAAPPQPGEPNTIGTYQPPFVKYINISANEIMFLEGHLVKFDRRPKEEAESEEPEEREDGRIVIDPRRMNRGFDNVPDYVERHYRGSGLREVESGEFKLKGVEATEHLYKSTAGDGTEFYIWAVLYKVTPEVDVALIFNAPATRDWRKWQGNFRRMAKTFQTLEVTRPDAIAGKVTDSAYRTKKRNELSLEVARNDGWFLDETENYFIISDVQDPAFMRELKQRLEAIRDVYEELYPAEQAERMRLLQRQKELEKPATTDDGKEEEEKEPELVLQTAVGVTPQELSRCSVVRVCSNQSMYHQYGGPGGSAGYWNWMSEELVIFDDKAGGGRRDTWAVLNHEAFHQYIFYFYGNLSPHSWYNEGTGDYFSGYQLQKNRFVLKPFDWRQRTIQSAIRSDDPKGKRTIVPLKDLVRLTQGEYYGNNKYGLGGGENYAQGWSFIYFLRTGKGKARGWNDAWNGILDVYLETLAATRDLDQAVDVAFAGVDWDALEQCWKNYTL